MSGGATGTFLLAPTVSVRLEAESYSVVTAREGEALIVFRGPEDARAYQRTSGKHTEAEGFIVLGLSDRALAAMLDKHALSWVVMPEPWTGDSSAGSDLFTRDNFMRLLAECPPAGPEGE
jgi:hypothetical protein